MFSITLTVNVTHVDIFFSHLYAWLHCNPTQNKEKRLPHAPHNNSMTHLPFMKPISTLIVLQPSYTYKTLPVSLQLCWSVYFIWFRASRIVKHLQHNQHSHVQNGGGELCCEEPLDPHQALYARDMFLLQTTLPVTMTTNRNFPSYTSPKCFSTQIPSSPPSQPPRSCYPLLCSQHPREFGEYTSIDLLQTSVVRPVTWLIQMSVRSLPRFFSFQAVSIWEPATLAESRTVQRNELSFFSRPCQSSKVLSGDPAVRPLWAIMHHRLGKLCRETLCLAFSGGMSEVLKDTLSHLFGLSHRMSSRKTLFFPGLQTEIDSPPPYLGDSPKMIGRKDTLRRRGRPRHRDAKPAEYRWGLDLFWTLWPLTSFHSHTLKCQRWMKICQRLYSGCVSAALSIWDLTFRQCLALSVFSKILNPRR